MAHQQIGVYNCWSCTKEIPVKKTDSGKLSAVCQWCDFPHYANTGTEHFKRLMAATRLHTAPEPEPATAPKTPEAEAPPPKPKARSFFNPLGSGK